MGHFRAHSADLEQRRAGPARVFVSGSPPVGAPWLDQGPLGSDGQQSQGQILCAHAQRPQTARSRCRRVAKAFDGCRTGAGYGVGDHQEIKELDMGEWGISFWLAAAGVFAIYNGLDWGRWQDLALWTRVHASIDLGTGLSMVLGAIGLLVTRRGLRTVALISAAAATLLGASLIAGSLCGTIPCTGPI